MSRQKVWSYHTGLATLDTVIVDPYARIALEALVSALRTNLEEEQRFESTSTVRMARAALIRQLNQFVLDYLHLSFNELCIIETDQIAQSPSYDVGFHQLRSFLPLDDPIVLLDVLDLEYRLWITVTNDLRSGSIERTRREGVEVLAALNHLAQTYSQQRFGDWLPASKTQIPRTSVPSTGLSSDDPNRQVKRPAGQPSLAFDYEVGLEALEEQMTSDESQNQLRRLAAALRHNLQEERGEEPSEERRNERNHLIYKLNDLALKQTGQSYNEWCRTR